MVSNRSFEYRLYRIKRDRPDVAAELLAGKYTVRLDNGQYAIDLIRAEREVYGISYGGRNCSSSPMGATASSPRAAAAERLRIQREIRHLVRVSARSPDYQRLILEQLRSVTWLVRELAGS